MGVSMLEEGVRSLWEPRPASLSLMWTLRSGADLRVGRAPDPPGGPSPGWAPDAPLAVVLPASLPGHTAPESAATRLQLSKSESLL